MEAVAVSFSFQAVILQLNALRHEVCTIPTRYPDPRVEKSLHVTSSSCSQSPSANVVVVLCMITYTNVPSNCCTQRLSWA
ncbi:hypothetical protein BS17DRAFT_572227 [Gyrodon lividus]|nr:hypothetical protein BS17DRAFT_572227 [Gyrodon lividus]